MARKVTKTVRLSEAELAVIQKMRESNLNGEVDETEATESTPDTTAGNLQSLADAFVSAIERTKEPSKKTVANRRSNTPWTPPLGTPRAKLKRKMYQHGIPIAERLSNEEIELLNNIRPGVYCDGNIRVNVRKDKGLDVDYPVRTAAQRLRLTNTYGITSFSALLRRLIAEKAEPQKYRKPEDADLYDLD